jgi:hypothetical protein
MRILGFAFLIAVFLANTVIVSAWAKPCMDSGSMDISKHSEMLMAHDDMSISNMPCEDMKQNQEQNDTQHCDGVCLCLHVSTHQSPILSDQASPSLSTLTSMKHDFIDDRFEDISTSSLKRPPRA